MFWIGLGAGLFVDSDRESVPNILSPIQKNCFRLFWVQVYTHQRGRIVIFVFSSFLFFLIPWREVLYITWDRLKCSKNRSSFPNPTSIEVCKHIWTGYFNFPSWLTLSTLNHSAEFRFSFHLQSIEHHTTASTWSLSRLLYRYNLMSWKWKF